MYSIHILLILSFLTIATVVFTTSSLPGPNLSIHPCGKMSQAQLLPSVQCSTCGRSVQSSPVKTNANGNQGRWLAKCVQMNETGRPWEFFRWLPGSRTPSLSPRLGSTNHLPDIAQPVEPAPPPFLPGAGGVQINLLPSVAPPKPTCLTAGCNSRRIRKGCEKKKCKAHCIEAGGCADPAHKGSDPIALTYVAAATPAATPVPTFAATTHPSAVPHNTSSMTSIDPELLRNEVQIAPLQLASSFRGPTRSRTEPTFSSHMTNIYTTEVALAEKMRETGRQMEATRLESKRKVQQTVFVYAWMEDRVAPAPFEVQEGFAWPHFILNEAVLVSAGFANISASTCFNIFRFNLGHWTTVKINHVVELKDAPRVFIKATHVQHCQDFETFLASTSLSSTAPNIRTNLAWERAYVKKKMSEYELSLALKKNKHSLSPDSPPSTTKRHRRLHHESPTPTVTKYRPPMHVPKFIGKKTPGATRVVKKTAARMEREMMECYDSDSGLEFTDPYPHSPAPSTSRSASAASISNSAASSSHAAPIIKEEDSNPTSLLEPFLIPPTRSGAAKQPKWPADFFAVDIIKFFNDIEDNAGDARVRFIFEHHFGQWVPYKHSTFYDHRQRWQGASLDAKQAVLSAGRTKAGCWSNFMSTTPAPRALLKAARKRNSKQVINVVDEEIIEISSDGDSQA